MKAVSAQELSFKFGRQTIFQKISLEIDAGEFFVIIGPNGTGKTTLLKTIAGLLKPASGEIELLGRSLKDINRRGLAKILAMVPQQTALDFPFTVAETVLMGRAPFLDPTAFEGKKDHAIANQAMKFTQVHHLARRPLNQLSGGERQRSIIARAICQEPKIILLDEPTASLDPAHQVRIMDLMEKLRIEQRVTVIMVSHDLNLAALYADRLLLLGHEGVEKVGPPVEVLTLELLEKVYNCQLLVEKSSSGEAIRIFPIPGRRHLN